MYKFALVGCGRIAERHAAIINEIGILKAVCDIDAKRADTMAAAYNAASYYSLESLLAGESDIDIVSVCTPNGFHAEHSIKALQAGKNVLCEKPLCITGAAAWQLVETEKFSRKKLFVVKSARYNPLLLELKKRIETGSLGKVYSFGLSCFWNRPDEYYSDWHGKAFPDGGTLYTQFSHYIDALYWLFGDVASVHAYASNAAHEASIEFEDTGVACLHMKSGVLGTVNWSVNTFRKNFEIGLTIVAEHGTVSLGGEYLEKLRYYEGSDPFDVSVIDQPANEYLSYKGSMSHHKEVYQNLVHALENNNEKSNAFDGLKTVEIIEKIYKAVSSSSLS
ncbi:MAG TPA: Gfo/Idh/MocA family oxidoreductase [Chitinophagaceae bacterium]|nr:Gfo/Idh/MocA family oxidoreductase [Chitinophagaceae bacterium]